MEQGWEQVMGKEQGRMMAGSGIRSGARIGAGNGKGAGMTEGWEWYREQGVEQGRNQ